MMSRKFNCYALMVLWKINLPFMFLGPTLSVLLRNSPIALFASASQDLSNSWFVLYLSLTSKSTQC